MKNIKLFILAIVACLLLAGCGNKTANVSSNDVLIQFGKNKITKSDLYYQMLEADSGLTVINEVTKVVLDAEIETTDELVNEAKSELESMREDLEGDLSGLLTSYGFETEDELLQQIIYSLKSDALIDKYIDENYDTIFEEYSPFKAKMIYIAIDTDTDSEGEAAKAEAQNILDQLKAGASFDDLAKEHSDKASLATETLYNSNSTIDYNVLKYAQTVSSPSLSEVMLSNDSNGYYIAQITVTNKEQLREDFVASLKKDTDFTTSVESSYFRAHNFQVYDKKTYDYIKGTYSSYLPASK